MRGFRPSLDQGGRSRTQFLHLPQIIEYTFGLNFVDYAQREPDVNDYVVADLGFRQASQADFLDDPTETHAPSTAERVLAWDHFEELAWNG